jgi:Lar family restriction alleviation protein
MQAIFPCPFCGADTGRLEEVDVEGLAVVCQGCGGIGPTGQGRMDATDRWNHRYTLAANLGLLRPTQPAI